MADKPKTKKPADDGPRPSDIGKSRLTKTWEKFRRGDVSISDLSPHMQKQIRMMQQIEERALNHPDKVPSDWALPFSSHATRDTKPVAGEHIHYG